MQSSENKNSSLDKSHKITEQKDAWFVAWITIATIVIFCGALWFGILHRTNKYTQESPEKGSEKPETVEMKADEAEIQVITTTGDAPVLKVKAVGTVESNQQKLQQITALVSGRVQAVNVSLGDKVSPGTLLIRIESPQVAEMHGKLHEAETRRKLAKLTLDRVKQAANRVSVLKAKATLDEAESTLKRTKQLVSEGLTARKDLVAAESEYERAQAEYNFQKDISLNKEVSEAIATLSTAETETEHLRDSLRALNAQLPKGEESEHSISMLELRSPISGVVIERLVNPGAGVEAGKPLLTIADTSKLWVIANVPEGEMPNIQIGMPAKVSIGKTTIDGIVNYIDPRLNEDTRTSRVRIVIDNPGNHIQVGSFAQIEFNMRPTLDAAVFIPSSAVQIIEGKAVVFVQGKTGQFAIRHIEAGQEIDGMIPVIKGLAIGEQIASKGSFVIKSKLLKDQLGDE